MQRLHADARGITLSPAASQGAPPRLLRRIVAGAPEAEDSPLAEGDAPAQPGPCLTWR